MNIHLLRGVFSGLIADVAGWVRGSIFRGGVAGWEIHAAQTAGHVLVGDGTDIRSVAIDGDVTLIGVLDTRYLRLNTINDPLTAGLEINATTLTEPVLILQTMDDNAGNPILEIQTSGGGMLSEIQVLGNLNFAVATAANPGMIEINDVRFLHNYGTNNLFIGLNAGNFALTGPRNIAIGESALTNVTSAYDNIAIGYQALQSLTTANPHVAIGYRALTSNTTGTNNFGIGLEAAANTTTGSRNVAIGGWSFLANISGNDNFALGNLSLRTCTASSGNIAIGTSAMESYTAGGLNIAIGTASHLFGSGWGNVAIGYLSLRGAIGLHNENVGIGYQALYSISTGDGNTAIGKNAGYELTTGGNNIFLGWQAGDALTTGASNIIIGYDIDATGVGVSNELNIGALIYGKLDTNRGGVNVTPPNLLATWHVDQPVDDVAIPVLILDQADISEGFINFIGSDRGVITGATDSVGSVRAEINGTVYRLALYVDA